MKITKNILIAIQSKVDSYGFGGRSALARDADVDPSYISRFLSGKNHEMLDRTWDKLKPYIEEYIEDEEEISMPRYKSRHTKSLVDIFEKLDRDNQLEVLGFSEDILEDQELGQDGEFLAYELEQLQARGITCKYGMEFSTTLPGLCWIYNALLLGKLPRNVLSNSILKEMLKIDLPVDYCRELRVKLLKLDVGTGKSYSFLAIYLDGTPPKLSTSILCINGVNKEFTLPLHMGTAFKLSNNSIFNLHFSDKEYKDLIAEKTIKADCPAI